MPKAEPESGMLLFWGVVMIYAIEYIGMGHYIPGVQKIPLFLSLLIFFVVFFGYNGRDVLKYGQTRALIVFLLHTGISMSYAIVGSYALRVFTVQVGYIILFISTFLVLKSSKQIRIFMASFVFYHCFLIVANLSKLTTSERTGSFKAGYFLGDGNDFSWSLTIFLPFALYLLTVTRNKIMKGMMIAAAGLFVAGLVGAGSRGAFLAISSAIGYLVLNSKKKAAAIVVAAILAVLAFALAPPAYIDRVQSIGEYQEDSSALGRMMAWKASIRMAIDHPIGVGAGNFNSAYGRFYRSSETDPRIWAGARWISPHSIYFLVLGEYGLIGLITICTLLFLNFRDNQQQVTAFVRLPPSSAQGVELATLPKYLNMSLVAFSVGGVFLGGVSYPHLFILTALILRTRQINGIDLQRGETTGQ